MAKDSSYNSDVSEIRKGIFMDCDPLNQPKGTRRFTLNAIEEVVDGKNKTSNEPSNFICTTLPDGFNHLGNVYIGDNTIFIISKNSTTGVEELGLIDKTSTYKSLVNTTILGLDIRNQCDIIFRLRKGKERVIYWVDSNNLIRTFNIDRPQNFYNQNYTLYLKSGGNPDSFVGEKWDVNSFNLIKTYSKIPFFNSVEVIESGNILPGSYNFAIQLVDEDLNPTAWITTSNTVNMYNDTIINTYSRIRGSRNVSNDSQSFPRTNKSIKLVISNLDQSFPYYRVAIIRSANNIGEVDKVLVSDLYSTFNSNFVYSGNDSSLKETSLESVLIDGEVIYAPKHLEQEENRLIVANTKGKSVNWCEFQKYASQIKTDLVTKEILLNSVDSQGNVKNPNSTFIVKGYMPGEVVSEGIVYLFDDGAISPVFHIPGKGPTDTESSMKLYEIDSNYLDIHNCSTDNYWGRDINNKSLVGNPVRHHRFPFRSEINKPLISSTGTTTTITKYKLSLVISLNPDYTPEPSYPDDGGSPAVPLIIPFNFNYQVTGAGSTTSFSGQLTEDMVSQGKQIILYNDVNVLTATGGKYAALDPASNLATYQVVDNNRFIITETYTPYTLSSSSDSDVAEILGFKFSNIQKPREDVVGFYIVRNERADDDRLIVDNAIIGPTTKFQQYVSFGLLMPKQYYSVNNCGRVADSGKTLAYDDKSMWFFNPEFQFLGKKLEFDEFKIEGTYTQKTPIDMPTISDTDDSTCNGGSGTGDTGGTKGVLIQDVQAGTSYDPNVNKKKDKDDDGFDLVIGYRNSDIQFTISNNNVVLPAKTKILYLNAASYQNFSTFTYYNVSVDNKIGMYLSDGTYDNTKLTNTDGSNTNALFYASMVKNNTTAYSNFLTRPYYKEHNNPVMFNNLNVINDFEVFNGDAAISATNIVSSVFYDMVVADRKKKSGLWKIIVGAVLIAASIVTIVVTAGVATPLAVAVGATALAGLGVSYGVALAMSGIKFEQFKNMIDTDYEKGLKDTVTDGGVFETVRDTIGREDDTIRWFTDRVSNVYIESSIPFGLRSGLTSGVSDFTDAPQAYSEEEFRSYLTEKFTVTDRDQGSGRLYKGYAGAEVYDINLDYMRFNKQKIYYHLPIEYDCCSDFREEYPLRRWFSEQSFQEEKIDNYRVFLPNNYSDMEGEHGEITDLYRLGNNLFIHTKEGLWQQPANIQERVTSEIVSFIGTGAFLSIPPRKVLDSTLGSGGTQHKWATVKTKVGVFSLSELDSSVYIHGEGINYLNTGVDSYFKQNLKSFLSEQMFMQYGIIYANDNNPFNPNGIGYVSVYDKEYERVIFTKKDYLILPSKISSLNVLGHIPISDEGFAYSTVNGLFYLGTTVLSLNNKDYFQNKSFTLSYSIDNKSWTSWHSYLPDSYIGSKNGFYSFTQDNKVWKHNQIGNYGNFYSIKYPFIIERVAISNPLNDSQYEDMIIQSNARRFDDITRHFINERYITFNKILLYNNYQSSKELELVVKETQDNPQDWYQHQITYTPNSILISKEGENWNLNDFRDAIVNFDKSIFSSSWEDIKDRYFIDKVVNPNAVEGVKNWYDLEVFSDKFIVIRLIFDNFNGINLGLNYSIDTQQITP